MRVLHLGKYYPPVEGGIETVTSQLARGLTALGARSDVLCAQPRRDMPELREELEGHTVYRAATPLVAASTPVSPRYVRLLAELAPSYDVLHLHCPNPLAALALRLVNPRAKVVVHWHSDVIRQVYFNKVYRFMLGDWLARRAAAVIGATSAHIQDSEYARAFAPKAHIIPFCMEAAPFAPELVDQAALARLRERFPGRKAVFTLGRLISYKGFEHLMDAAALLPPEWVALIGGTGPLKAELEARIRAKGLEGRAVLLGRVEQGELSAHFAFSRVFCLPSVTRAEMFGMVQLEAMACGRPVVSTRIKGSGVPLVNEHGVTGLTVEPGDAGALARAIMEIDADEKRWQAMSSAGLEAVRTKYAPEAMFEAVLGVYRGICGE